VTADGFEALDSRPIEGQVIEGNVVRTDDECAVLVRRSNHQAECWRFSLPQWTLRARTELICMTRHCTVSSRGRVFWAHPLAETGANARSGVHMSVADSSADKVSTLVDPTLGTVCALVSEMPWIAVGVRDEARDEIRVHLIWMDTLSVHRTIALEGARSVTLRLSHGAMVVADELGRVIVMDTEYGDLWRNLRV
jgi:hypothetical protein